LGLCRNGLRRSGRRPRALRFDRDQPGSERNPQGSSRTLVSRSKTLQISG